MRYFVGIGSNLGDRLASLRGAAGELAHQGQVVARSRIYVASPVGGPPQPPYMNAALSLECDLPAEELLARCHDIERHFGRDRPNEVRWGPRTLDLDLLLMGARGEVLMKEPALEIPHPRMHERAFALAPLIDLDPRLVHPTLGRTLSSLLHVVQSRGHLLAPTGEHL